MRVKLLLARPYENPLCKIDSTYVDVEIPLVDGEHTVTTPLTDIGSLKDNTRSIVQAQISFRYKYDFKNEIIHLWPNDRIAKDSMQLKTVVKGTTRTGIHRTYQDAENCIDEQSDAALFTIDLLTQFEETVRKANNQMIEAVKKSDLFVNLLYPLPMMKEEDRERLRVVYKKGRFLELYNPAKVYSSDHIIPSIDSVYNGTTSFFQGEIFANVLYSTKDPKTTVPESGETEMSWLSLWKAAWKTEIDVCSSYMWPRLPKYHNQSFPCSPRNGLNHNLVGGHVIKGWNAREPDKGADDVFIIPICHAHNNYSYEGVMGALQNQRVVKLKNYFGK